MWTSFSFLDIQSPLDSSINIFSVTLFLFFFSFFLYFSLFLFLDLSSPRGSSFLPSTRWEEEEGMIDRRRKRTREFLPMKKKKKK